MLDYLLSIEFAKYFDVLGYDIDTERVDELNKLEDKTGEANLDDLERVLNQKLKLSAQEKDLKWIQYLYNYCSNTYYKI